MLIHVQHHSGEALPFGGEVQDDQGQVVGVVGQAGRIMARVTRKSGRLSVAWGDPEAPSHRCSFDYRAPAGPSRDRNGVYATEQATCVDSSTNKPSGRANG